MEKMEKEKFLENGNTGVILYFYSLNIDI